MIARHAAGYTRALRPCAMNNAVRLRKRLDICRFESTISTSDKIDGIVNQISQLTLMETADLVTTLKVIVGHKLQKQLSIESIYR